MDKYLSIDLKGVSGEERKKAINVVRCLVGTRFPLGHHNDGHATLIGVGLHKGYQFVYQRDDYENTLVQTSVLKIKLSEVKVCPWACMKYGVPVELYLDPLNNDGMELIGRYRFPDNIVTVSKIIFNDNYSRLFWLWEKYLPKGVTIIEE